MVTAENWTFRPFTGWGQFLSARARMAVLGAPRAGGALRSAPTMENRNRAHKAPVERDCVWVITSPHKSSEGTEKRSIPRPIRLLDEHLLRAGRAHRETLTDRAPGIAIGA